LRLPYLDFDHQAFSQVEIGLVGIPWDGGTTNRAGARHGPRQVRDLSTTNPQRQPRQRHQPLRAVAPAPIWDTPVNPVDAMDTMSRIQTYFERVRGAGIAPPPSAATTLSTLPIMRALAEESGPVGMAHFDAHTDTWGQLLRRSQGHPREHPFGAPSKKVCWTRSRPSESASGAHSTTTSRTPGVGSRASAWKIDIDEFHAMGIDAVMAEARRIVGDGATDVSFVRWTGTGIRSTRRGTARPKLAA
jgi:guanidinopropionase